MGVSREGTLELLHDWKDLFLNLGSEYIDIYFITHELIRIYFILS